ncbi:AN1-type zinc finger protein 1 [Spea bombifrons]|uniref:AN1-type zinc finger protein 1 n=1 Tax=Spea bombifrons TaxID=233779 RepID=UPI002349F19C|nr:AN1-type zinc finger protein 1 [Spea bombifrons]XP_053323962.1 AN1-type zinc finger protein 1 [Spea bombifrons]
MAELDIGQHCGVEHCGQLDFLPFVCDACSRVFCLQHRSRDCHGCPEVTPIADCEKSGASTLYPCTYKSCSGKELVQVLCPYCEKHFCLGHRHQPDHECEKLEIPKPRMCATQQLVREIVDSKKSAAPAKGRKGAKSSETAAKVALMKLKLHAVGDKSLPQSERVYFQVYLPKGTKEKSKPMFFCTKWSIGKVVDYAASLASLKNDNNKAAAKKLRICHAETGQVLPLDNSLETLISSSENPLYTGGNIIIEYLENETSMLQDANSYLI